MSTTPGRLSEHASQEVNAAVAALEAAIEPVPADAFPALRDPALLAEVRVRLSLLGRCLLPAGDGLLSGYDDHIADRLAADGIGVLAEIDRAVLAVVLLTTVAIPRAQRRLEGADWRQGEPVTVEELARNPHLRVGAIKASLQRLRAAGILTGPTRRGRSLRGSPRHGPRCCGRTSCCWAGQAASTPRKSVGAGWLLAVTVAAMTDTLFTTSAQPVDGHDLGIVGDRPLLCVQTFSIARLPSHPVPIIPGALLVVTGRGPVGDSNESGKTRFLGAVSLLLGDRDWRSGPSVGRAVRALLFAEDRAGGTGARFGTAQHGYVVGVFADPAQPATTAITVWCRINQTRPLPAGALDAGAVANCRRH